MIYKSFLAAVVVAMLGVAGQAALAFPAAQLSKPPQAGVEQVTFWGKPFPYHYSWSLTKACTRYETVETPRGPATKRVWVCDVGGRSGAVVSYRN